GCPGPMLSRTSNRYGIHVSSHHSASRSVGNSFGVRFASHPFPRRAVHIGHRAPFRSLRPWCTTASIASTFALCPATRLLSVKLLHHFKHLVATKPSKLFKSDKQLQGWPAAFLLQVVPRTLSQSQLLGNGIAA